MTKEDEEEEEGSEDDDEEASIVSPEDLQQLARGLRKVPRRPAPPLGLPEELHQVWLDIWARKLAQRARKVYG